MTTNNSQFWRHKLYPTDVCGTDQRGKEQWLLYFGWKRSEIEIRNHSFVPDAISLPNARVCLLLSAWSEHRSHDVSIRSKRQSDIRISRIGTCNYNWKPRVYLNIWYCVYCCWFDGYIIFFFFASHLHRTRDRTHNMEEKEQPGVKPMKQWIFLYLIYLLDFCKYIIPTCKVFSKFKRF